MHLLLSILAFEHFIVQTHARHAHPLLLTYSCVRLLTKSVQAVEAGQAAGHTGLSSGLFAINAFTLHFFNIMRQMKSSIGAALAPPGPEEGVAQAAASLRVTTQTSASRAARRLEIALANQMEHSLAAMRELLWLFLVRSAADCAEWS